MTSLLDSRPTTHRAPVAELLAQQRRLAREFGSLDRAVWRQPSRCAGWRNARVLAHLAAGADLYRASIVRALEGDATFSDAAATSVACFEVRQERLTEAPSNVLLETFAASGEALARLFVSLSDDQLGLPAWHPLRQVTIGTLLNFRLFELGFHAWDIRASVESHATIQPALTPFLTGFVRQAQRRYCQPALDLDLTCRFEVGDAAWTLAVRDGRVADAPLDAPVSMRIQTDPSTFLLLATRRQRLANVARQVAIHGEPEQAALLLEATSFRI